MSAEKPAGHDDVKLPGIETQLERLRELAPPGFVLVFDITWSGPKYTHFEYPQEWRDTYEGKNYFILDPVFYWTMTSKGRKRWSELRLPDPAKIFEKGKKYDLNFGAVFSMRSKRSRSFLTAARSDREFTDAELVEMNKLFKECVDICSQQS